MFDVNSQAAIYLHNVKFCCSPYRLEIQLLKNGVVTERLKEYRQKV